MKNVGFRWRYVMLIGCLGTEQLAACADAVLGDSGTQLSRELVITITTFDSLGLRSCSRRWKIERSNEKNKDRMT